MYVLETLWSLVHGHFLCTKEKISLILICQMALHIVLLDQQWQFRHIEGICRGDKRRCLSPSLSAVMLAPVLCCEELRLPVLCHTLCAGNSGSSCHGVLHYTRSNLMGYFQWLLTLFLFHFKPWVTEVKYSDPSLHLASKGGIQPLYTVGTAASKDIASIHTGKCLQHLLITSRGKAGLS